jgi:hypothetical protein
MNSMKRRFPLILILALASCHRPATTPGVLEREKFVRTYIALLKQCTRAPGGGTDSTFSRNKAGLFAEEGITEEQFRNTIRSYAARPEEWKDFFDEVIQRLGEQTLDEHAKASSPPGALTFPAGPSSR